MSKSISRQLALWAVIIFCSCCVFADEAEKEGVSYADLVKRVSQLERVVEKLTRNQDLSTLLISQELENPREAEIDELDLLARRVGRIKNDKKVTNKSQAKFNGDAQKAYESITKLIESKNYTKAQSEAGLYIDRYPTGKNLQDVYFWLGEIKMLFGRSLEAKVYYQKALELMKGKARTSEILLKLFVISHQRGEDKERNYHFEKLKDKYPDSTAFHMAKLQKQKYEQGKS